MAIHYLYNGELSEIAPAGISIPTIPSSVCSIIYDTIFITTGIPNTEIKLERNLLFGDINDKTDSKGIKNICVFGTKTRVSVRKTSSDGLPAIDFGSNPGNWFIIGTLELGKLHVGDIFVCIAVPIPTPALPAFPSPILFPYPSPVLPLPALPEKPSCTSLTTKVKTIETPTDFKLDMPFKIKLFGIKEVCDLIETPLNGTGTISFGSLNKTFDITDGKAFNPDSGIFDIKDVFTVDELTKLLLTTPTTSPSFPLTIKIKDFTKTKNIGVPTPTSAEPVSSPTGSNMIFYTDTTTSPGNKKYDITINNVIVNSGTRQESYDVGQILFPYCEKGNSVFVNGVPYTRLCSIDSIFSTKFNNCQKLNWNPYLKIDSKRFTGYVFITQPLWWMILDTSNPFEKYNRTTYGDENHIPAIYTDKSGIEHLAVISGEFVIVDTADNGGIGETVFNKKDVVIIPPVYGMTTKILEEPSCTNPTIDATFEIPTTPEFKLDMPFKIKLFGIKEVCNSIATVLDGIGTIKFGSLSKTFDITQGKAFNSSGIFDIKDIFTTPELTELLNVSSATTLPLTVTIKDYTKTKNITIPSTETVCKPTQILNPATGICEDSAILLTIDSQSNLKGTVVINTTGLLWNITAPTNKLLWYGSPGDLPATYIDSSGNGQMALIRGTNIFLDENLSAGNAEVVKSIDEVIISPTAPNKTTRLTIIKKPIEKPTPTIPSCDSKTVSIDTINTPSELIPSSAFKISLYGIKEICATDPSNPAFIKKITGEKGTAALGSVSAPFKISSGQAVFDLNSLLSLTPDKLSTDLSTKKLTGKTTYGIKTIGTKTISLLKLQIRDFIYEQDIPLYIPSPIEKPEKPEKPTPSDCTGKILAPYTFNLNPSRSRAPNSILIPIKFVDTESSTPKSTIPMNILVDGYSVDNYENRRFSNFNIITLLKRAEADFDIEHEVTIEAADKSCTVTPYTISVPALNPTTSSISKPVTAPVVVEPIIAYENIVSFASIGKEYLPDAYEGEQITLSAYVNCITNGVRSSPQNVAMLIIDGVVTDSRPVINGIVTFVWTATSIPISLHTICISVAPSSNCNAIGKDCRKINVSSVVLDITEQINRERNAEAEQRQLLEDIRDSLRTDILSAGLTKTPIYKISDSSYIPITTLPTVTQPEIGTIITQPEIGTIITQPDMGTIKLIGLLTLPAQIFLDGKSITTTNSLPLYIPTTVGSHKLYSQIGAISTPVKSIKVYKNTTTNVSLF